MIEYFNINQTTFNTTSTMNFMKLYVQSLPELVKSGDFTAITVSIILFLVGLIVINKITNAMMKIIESFLVLTIISYASYLFASVFMSKIEIEGLTLESVLVLTIGILAIASGLIAGIKSIITHTSKYNLLKGNDFENKNNSVKNNNVKEKPIELDKLMKFNSFTSDESIGKRLAYLVISEFGVFSSKTISAPTPAVGISIFLIFLIGMLLYILSSHKDKTKELRYFIITLIVSFIVSIILAATWSLYSPSNIFSLNFFSSEALVAVITGTGISMYMGGK